MAKNTSKKIKELRGVKPEKVTDEQLKKVQEVINEINRSQMDIGQMEVRKHAITHHITKLQEDVNVIRDEFEKEYGTADVNIQDGTINYEENVEADKKD
jgi:hypothetical protein|tara:strand:+ start:2992 stop:3288 length:297 start_codon:yes stop_codon:yes gene_type:complete